MMLMNIIASRGCKKQATILCEIIFHTLQRERSRAAAAANPSHIFMHSRKLKAINISAFSYSLWFFVV
jgi:hypothetical protein